MGLKGGDLLVDSGNVLLNYICELLYLWLLLDKSPTKARFAYANFHGTIVEQGLPFGDWSGCVDKGEIGAETAHSRWASFPRRIVVVLMSLAMEEATLVNSLLGESFA